MPMKPLRLHGMMRMTVILHMTENHDDEVIRIFPEDGDDSTDEEQLSDTEIITIMITRSGRRAASFISRFQDFYLYFQPYFYL